MIPSFTRISGATLLVFSLASSAVAIEQRIRPTQPLVLAPVKPGNIVVYKTQTLNCTNGSSYTVSTGTDGGRCTVNEKGDSVVCVDDKQGGVATANCFGGCGSTFHGGTCTKQ
jgi:hypothetical protein